MEVTITASTANRLAKKSPALMSPLLIQLRELDGVASVCNGQAPFVHRNPANRLCLDLDLFCPEALFHSFESSGDFSERDEGNHEMHTEKRGNRTWQSFHVLNLEL